MKVDNILEKILSKDMLKYQYKNLCFYKIFNKYYYVYGNFFVSRYGFTFRSAEQLTLASIKLIVGHSRPVLKDFKYNV